MSRYMKSKALVPAVAVLACAVLAGCGDDESDTKATTAASEAAATTAAEKPKSDKPYKAVLSINFAGNPVRQQLMRIMDLATEEGELAGRVELETALAADTVQAQAQSIDNIARKKPDILIVLPSSGTGLTAAIKRACDAGVTVVAFDSVVTAPCAPSVAPEFSEYSVRLGSWLAEQADEGVIFVDRGTPGIPAVEEMFNGYKKGIEETNPKIKVVPFEGKLSPGGIKAAISNLLPGHRDNLVGVAGISIATSAMDAIKEAGLDPVPQTTVTAVNADMQACLGDGQKCLFGAVPGTLGADALKLGVELADGTADPSKKRISPPATWYGNAGAPSKYPDVQPEKIEIGKNAFPDLPETLQMPFSAEWLPLTAEQVAGK